MKTNPSILIAMLVATSATSHAATTLLAYDFQSDLAPSTSAMGVTGTAFSNGAGMASIGRFAKDATVSNVSQGSTTGSASISTGTITASTQVINAAPSVASDDAAASAVGTGGIPSSTVFLTFKATASSGNNLDLTSLSFDITRGGTSTTRGLYLFYSTNDFATSAALIGSYSNAVSGIEDWSKVTFNLTSIPDAANVTFRFNQVGGINNSLKYDNVILSGDLVNVPEPSAMILGSLGSILLLRRRI